MESTIPSDTAEGWVSVAVRTFPIGAFPIWAFAGLLIALVTVLAPRAGYAQDGAEFSQNFYNATKCMKVDEVNNNGLRTIVAQNLCNANVAALICYRIIQATNVYKEIGWYCDYSNLYGPGTTKTISRSGYYHPKREIAACAVGNARCTQVLRTTEVRVGENRQNPQKTAQAIRAQVGG